MDEIKENPIIEKAFLATCKKLGIDEKSTNANFHLVTASEIQELNKTHRGKDAVTDTLSFPLLNLTAGEIPTPTNFPYDTNPDTGKIELGDIIICEDETEIAFLYVHSLLHLLGYTHDTDEDYDAMMQLTHTILEGL